VSKGSGKKEIPKSEVVSNENETAIVQEESEFDKKKKLINAIRDALINNRSALMARFLKKQARVGQAIENYPEDQMSPFELLAVFKTITDYVEKNSEIISQQQVDVEAKKDIKYREVLNFSFEERTMLRGVLKKVKDGEKIDFTSTEGKVLIAFLNEIKRRKGIDSPDLTTEDEAMIMKMMDKLYGQKR